MRISDWSSDVCSSDLLDLCPARLPGGAAEPIEQMFAFFRTVARQGVDVFDRHIELVAAGVDHAQTVVRRAPGHHRLQPIIAADAVLDMDHQVALAEGRGFGNELLRAPALAPRPRAPVAENLLLADEDRKSPRLHSRHS